MCQQLTTWVILSGSHHEVCILQEKSATSRFRDQFAPLNEIGATMTCKDVKAGHQRPHYDLWTPGQLFC